MKPQHSSRYQQPRALNSFDQLRSVVGFTFKSVGLIAWFVILLLALLEIKRYYNIDVIPGYDSAVDDAYGAARGTLSEWMD